MADNYSLVDNASDLDNSLNEKYADYNKHKLKKCLRLLKTNELENLNGIRFVSKLLRSKIQTEQSSVTTTSANINHNELIKSDFWKYVKRFIEKPKKILSTFNQIVCTEYFRKTLQSINPTKRFTIPSWLPAFKTPTYQYDITPPTYQEITKIIRRMKASGQHVLLTKSLSSCSKGAHICVHICSLFSEKFLVQDRFPLCGKTQLRFLFTKKASKMMHTISDRLPLKLSL